MVAQIQALRGRSALKLTAAAAAVLIVLILVPSYFDTYQVQLLIYGLIARSQRSGSTCCSATPACCRSAIPPILASAPILSPS